MNETKTARKTKKPTKRSVVRNVSLLIKGPQLKKLTSAYEAAGGKGNIKTFAAKCLTRGIVKGKA